MKTDCFIKTTYESSLLDERYDKYTHSSGLEVYVFPKKFSTTYALFGVKYGSINNSFFKDGKKITVPDGIAHFLEHKLFFNEDGSDSFERFSELGCDPNAYTSFNKTAYLFSCTDNLLPSLAELITFVTHPYFTPESVASELGIIGEEIRMYDDNPGDRCFYGMLEGMYKNHSIRKNICGSQSSIARISADTLYDCYNAFYKPSNMALIVCGNVNADDVLSVIEKNLPTDFCGDAVGIINENTIEERTAYREYVEQSMQVSKPLFNIGFKDIDISKNPIERQKKDAVMAILNEMLFSRAGELYSDLVENKFISPSWSYGYTISETFAYNSIAGEANEPKLVLEKIFSHLEKTRAEGFCDEDFHRAKRVMYAEAVRLFDSVESIANTLFSFVCEDASIFEYADALDSVTLDDVKEAFKNSFDRSTVTLSVIKSL